MKTTAQPWAIAAAQALSTRFNFPLTPRRWKNDQAVSACPHCRAGDDRLVIFEDGNYWCRRCEKRGWWKNQDKEEREQRKVFEERKRNQLKAQIASCQDWQQYHGQVGKGFEVWRQHGIVTEDIDKWGLGWCEQAPCCDYPSASLTIPVFSENRLVDIRHRLITPQNNDKYRSHLPGLPPSFFNGDITLSHHDRVYVVEGEKKAIILNRYGFPTLSFPGVGSRHALLHLLCRRLKGAQEVVFVPDPGSEDQLIKTILETEINFKVSLVDMFMKPDDFVMRYGSERLTQAVVYRRFIH